MDFGAFILGILFGWLVEWLYVTFFSSKGTDMGDCTAFERELKTRNDEIKSLKSQLSDNSQGGASLLSKASKQSTAKASTVSNKPKLNKSKAEAATKNTKSSKASPKEVAKSTKSKVLPKKVAGTASTSTTKTAVKKSASSKPTTKTVKKTTARSTTTKKKPAAKKISLKKDIKLNNPTGDDLTKLSGIGPSMAATLGELGITSYKKLAAMDDDILRDMLEASGARLNNNKEAMDSWNEQATLADKGDFTGLKKLQESLKSLVKER